MNLKNIIYDYNNHIHNINGFYIHSLDKKYIIEQLSINKNSNYNKKYKNKFQLKIYFDNNEINNEIKKKMDLNFIKKNIENILHVYLLNNINHINHYINNNFNSIIKLDSDYKLSHDNFYEFDYILKLVNDKTFINLENSNINLKVNIYKNKLEKYLNKNNQIITNHIELNNNKINKYKYKLNNIIQLGGECNPEPNTEDNRNVRLIATYGEPVINFYCSIILEYLFNNLGNIENIFSRLRIPRSFDQEDVIKIFFTQPEVISFMSHGRTRDNLELEITRNISSMGRRDENFKTIILLEKNNFLDNFNDLNRWKSIILKDHLLFNKYAHNGIDVENDDIIENILEDLRHNNNNTNRYLGLQFIHGYLHTLDQIYVYNLNDIDNLNLSKRKITNLRSCIPNIKLRCCIEKLLQRNRGLFLEKTGNSYILPYKIKDEAIEDKLRQYIGDIINNPNILRAINTLNRRPLDKSQIIRFLQLLEINNEQLHPDFIRELLISYSLSDPLSLNITYIHKIIANLDRIKYFDKTSRGANGKTNKIINDNYFTIIDGLGDPDCTENNNNIEDPSNNAVQPLNNAVQTRNNSARHPNNSVRPRNNSARHPNNTSMSHNT